MSHNTITSICFVVVLSVVFASSDVFAQHNNGSIELDIKYNNGDRVDFSETEVLVYNNSDKSIVFQQNLSSNPYTISDLQIGSKYKIEIFVNNVLANTQVVNLQTELQNVDSIIPLSGGLQVSTFFKDGHTPIKDARVIIKSQDGTIIRDGTTNKDGNTLRYWLQSTTQTEQFSSDNYFYDIEVYIGNLQVASAKKINIQPGLKIDQKIIATVPSILEELVSVTIYKNDLKKLEKTDDAYKVFLYDIHGALAYQSTIGARSEAHFSNIKPGEYQAVVVNKASEPITESASLTLIGTQKKFDLFLNESKIIQDDTSSSIISCSCVAFRLDDIQDYWLNDVQIAIIDRFTSQNIPLTIGVIGDSFGSDQKITSYITEQHKTTANLEIASHGVGNQPFTELTKDEQSQKIYQTNEKLVSIFGVKPTVFIPPQNRFNEDTITALRENDMTHLSSSLVFDTSDSFPLQNSDVYRFPEIATTGQYDANSGIFVGVKNETIFSKILEGIDKYGFAVITMHPQEFSILENGIYENDVNLQQIEELDNLIDKLLESDLKIVSINQINLDHDEKIPEWIKNNAAWWSDGQINDETFTSGIEFLVKNKIIIVNKDVSYENNTLSEIPEWIKNNAAWWAQDLISDKEFLNGIKFLINAEIVKI